MWAKLKESKWMKFVTLFASLGTLFCCTLPSVIIILGFGASLASFLNEYPALITISENKNAIFGLSFFMLALSFLAQKKAQKLVCPVDKKEVCQNTRKWSNSLLYVTLGINVISSFYVFVLPYLL
jgi:hypothetical protein